MERSLESERARNMLIQRITDGNIGYNSLISERKLSEELGIGRTPTREAIRDLVNDGILEAIPARGTFLRRLSMKQVRDIFEVRCSLESLAAYLTAKQGISRSLSRFSSTFKVFLEDLEGNDPKKMSEMGEAFHRELVLSADNEALYEILTPLRIRYQVAFNLPRHFDHRWIRHSVKAHLAILEAIEIRDAPLSKKLMRNHLREGLEIRLRIMNRLTEGPI